MIQNSLNISALYLLTASAVTGFLLPQSCSSVWIVRQSTCIHLWLGKPLDQFNNFLNQFSSVGQFLDAGEETIDCHPLNNTNLETKKDRAGKVGRILRLAARAYDTDSSRPSSPLYTTRKDSKLTVSITPNGVEDDYNHYRTIALQSTLDRAVSIVTTNSMEFVRTHYPSAQDGDLGENLYVDGVAHASFWAGATVTIGDNVRLQITEPIEPCANLCKLPYINDAKQSPKQRIENCQSFLSRLDISDGLRGWYAKVLQPGMVRVGDAIRLG